MMQAPLKSCNIQFIKNMQKSKQEIYTPFIRNPDFIGRPQILKNLKPC